jgi:hypothetical protein
VRAFIAEIDHAAERAERGDPAHLGDMIVRLARVAVLRNTQIEERTAAEKDESLRELRALRSDVLALVGDGPVGAEIEERFARARFPFLHDRLIPRITVRGSLEGEGLEPGFRTQQPWPEHAKRTLIERGRRLTDETLRAIEQPAEGSGT